MITQLLTQVILISLTINLANTALLANLKSDARLPTTIIPNHYDIELKTYLPGYAWQDDERRLTFEGTVVITADVLEATDQIVLNAASLNITKVDITDKTVNVTGWELSEEQQFLTINLSGEILPQEGFAFLINFNGKLGTRVNGYFSMISVRADGSSKYHAATQFEKSAARFMIPCFDEPEFKATWKVKLEYPTGAVALSNGIELRTSSYLDWTVTDFEQTVRMSSYLLAVSIGDVQFKETTTSRGLRIRVYVEPAQVNNIDHALEVSRRAVEGFEELFGIEYPMRKLDFVAVPGFSGAMENWGLIVHNSDTLVGNSEGVTIVVIHEIAHQWFGNLVTMKYWDEVWLNEGFADFWEAQGRAFLNSSLDKDFLRTKESQSWGFLIDQQLPLHAYDVNEGIAQNNYNKGSSLIRMIQKIVGDSNFIQSIQYYLNENQYENVEELDLYKALTMFAPQIAGPDGKPFDLADFSYCWTHQNGYPTVHVEKVSEGKVSLTQNMDVLMEDKFRKYGVCGYKWDIPIWYQRNGQGDVNLTWLGRNDDQLELDVELPVLINANSQGFYKVIYSDELYKEIGENYEMSSQHYSPSSKFRLISDALDAVWLDNYQAASFLDILKSALLDEQVKEIAENVLARAFFKESGKENPDNEVLSQLEGLVDRHISRIPLLEKCTADDFFYSCYLKSNFHHQACARILVDTKNYNATLDLLFGWLDEKSLIILDPIITCAVPSELVVEYLTDKFTPATIGTTTIEKREASAAWRLPTNVIPLHYDLRLDTFLPGYAWEADERNMTFEATVEITVKIVEATDKIVFHSDSLNIKGVYTDVELFNTTVTNWKLTPEHQFLTVFLSQTLLPNDQLSFKVRYNGTVRTDLKGYYLTHSYKPNGDLVFNAVTQFESTDARKMVPCFDEPEYKAFWDVALHHPAGSVALSNGIGESMPRASDNFTITIFNTTEKMSSYLLAVFIGDLEVKETTTDSGVRIRVYTDPRHIDQIDFALNVSRLTVEGFEKQFGINYPTPKIDFVSAQNFQFGAMENWGLIVHKLNQLVGTSNHVKTTVIHELAHQWFGNLVTMQFWDSLWLNEGFATYMTYRGLVHLDPTYDRQFGLVSESQEQTFSNDNGELGPLSRYEHEENGNIENKGPDYIKGSSFILMLEHIIGTANFDLAMKFYLGVNQYQNVIPLDLYEAIIRFMPAETLGPNGQPFSLAELAAFAECWTDQKGYPTIKVELKGRDTFVLTQNYEGEKGNDTEAVCGYKWDVPIWYQDIGSDDVQLTWMSRNGEELEMDANLIINADSNGLYRVRYSNSALEVISNRFREFKENLSDSTKYRLVSDLLHFIGDYDVKTVLPIIEPLFNDTNTEVQDMAKLILSYFYSQEEERDNSSSLATILEKLVAQNIKIGEILVNCALEDGAAKCFDKYNLTRISNACLSIRHASNRDIVIQRLLDWLGTNQKDIALNLVYKCGLERELSKNPGALQKDSKKSQQKKIERFFKRNSMTNFM